MVEQLQVIEKYLELKVLKQKVILKVMNASVKKLEMNECFLPDENRLLREVEEVVTCLGEQKTVVRRSLVELVKTVATHFVGTAICIKRAIPKWYFREIFELDYFRRHLKWRYIGRF